MQLKSLMFSAAFAAMISGGANANILYDFYVGAAAGIGGQTSFIDGHANTDTAQSYGAVVGLDIPLIRIEAEYNYLTANENSMQLGLIDAYLKMPAGILQPYVGAGVGLMFAGDFDLGDADTTTAYQAMAGITINTVVLPFHVDVEARALYVPDAISIANDTHDVLHYEGRVKLRYVF